VSATFRLKSASSSKPPKYCTKYFVEFSGKQQKLSAFFSQNSSSAQTAATSCNGEKRKWIEAGSDPAAKRPKNGQQQQKSLLNFFKPQNPPKSVEVASQSERIVPIEQENRSDVEEMNPEKRVQVRTC
jgi:hypothetical protein